MSDTESECGGLSILFVSHTESILSVACVLYKGYHVRCDQTLTVGDVSAGVKILFFFSRKV